MKRIVDPLLNWYQKTRRVLPWRLNKNPYHIWISEVMLQQTRIEAVIPYYERFMSELPTISALARVEDDKLMKLWEGLGYYNRARNLKKAAIEIEEKFNGRFPDKFEDIISLPGIGEYTASAIASICFSLKEVTIDGNVLRVYSRLKNSKENIDEVKVRKSVRESLMKIVPKESGMFNEALMELGEVICIPNGIPKCNLCPLKDFCKAKEKHTFMNIPVRKEKREKKNQKYVVLLLLCGNKVALHKRKDSGLLKNLWEFPNLLGTYTKEEVKQYLLDCSMTVTSIKLSGSYTHIFTHLKWQMESFIIKVEEESKDYLWLDLDTIIKKYALPSAFQPFLEIVINEVKK